MSTQAFLQDYVEEVQEHLLAMEKSLLILEQEGADQEHISHIFRAAHSLKGASAYMGFEGLAKLTHEMESLISEIQRNSRAIPTNGISVLLKCVDMITGAVEHLSREGTEPDMDESFLQGLRSAFSSGESPQNFAEKQPVHPVDDQELQSFFQEEDEELLSIFTQSFRENYTSLVELLESSSGPSLTPDEKKTARELAGKLISSARYMDYQPVVTILAEWEKNLGTLNGAGPDRFQLLELFKACGAALEKMLPGLIVARPASSEHIAYELPLEEEDEELFSIFFNAFQQNLSKLAETVLSAAITDQDVDRALELTGCLITSSNYMDYEDIVELLGGWKEFLTVLKGRAEKDPATTQETFSSLCSELSRKLKGLAVPGPKVGEARLTTLPSLDDDIDFLFKLPADETLPAPENHGDRRDLALTSGEVRPLHPKDSVPEKKERTVAFVEDIQQNAATLRVDAQKVDQLLNQVGELVVTRSEFIQTATLFRDLLRDLAAQGLLPKTELRQLRLLGFRLNESTLSLGRVANDLQASVMRVRMLPIIQLFERFPRIVRDQALKLSKKAELIIEGGETEIDKRVLERMNDPLIQFIRNALVHGIETPAERKLAGKPETATIRLTAYQAGDYVAIEVEDDGRGIDTEKLRNLLRNHEDFTQHEIDRLSDEEISHAIFLPGISTYENVDGAAGRGVGLDVVKENVENMSGSIEVESSPGLGTRFVIRIPLTVAIIRALLVREGEQIFTLPLNSVSEILRYRPGDTRSIEGFPVISLRGKTIPLVYLQQLLNMKPCLPASGRKFIVIVSTSFREVGLVVDGLVGEREVVIKSIDNGFHPIQGFSGATILGDGRVSLILDVSSMLRMLKNNSFAALAKGAQTSDSVH